jgi:hypothetical protein
MACYSGQVPGVFELTPYNTLEPLPTPANSRFQVGDTVLAPPESNRAFFNLSNDPEPLRDNLTNSKEMCLPNSTGEVLYVGTDKNQDNYYLVDCAGSVGWADEGRILGPLNFAQGDLALTIAQSGTQMKMLDLVTFQPMPFSACQPGMITPVMAIEATDADADGKTEIYYQIDCPTGNRGWVTGADLLGPLEINVDDRALAIDPEGTGGDYRLADSPGRLTSANAVEGTCPQGSILTAQEARPMGDTVYYRVTCGDNVEGWVDQDRFVGPLRYDEGQDTMIYVPSQFLFADQLPEGAVIATPSSDDAAVSEGEAPAADTEPAADTQAAEGEAGGRRDVVEYTPPLVLSANPGASADESGTVGECLSGTLAHVEEYQGEETIYYRITCASTTCTEEGVNADGETICNAYENYTGWVQQSYLQGPVEFVPGDHTQFNDSSDAVEADNEGRMYARIARTQEGAFTLGRFTDYAGRCPIETGVDVLDVAILKDSTRNSFTFYYEIQCTGESAVRTFSTDSSGTVRPEISYSIGEEVPVTGWSLGRDLVPTEGETAQ